MVIKKDYVSVCSVEKFTKCFYEEYLLKLQQFASSVFPRPLAETKNPLALLEHFSGHHNLCKNGFPRGPTLSPVTPIFHFLVTHKLVPVNHSQIVAEEGKERSHPTLLLTKENRTSW